MGKEESFPIERRKERKGLLIRSDGKKRRDRSELLFFLRLSLSNLALSLDMEFLFGKGGEKKYQTFNTILIFHLVE